MSEDFDLLRLVFSFHIVDQIVHADEEVTPDEIAWVVRRFPRELLERHGLIGADDVLTVRYRSLLAQALVRVPTELDEGGKLALIHEFFDLALSDGEFEYREGNMLLVAARLLGLPPEAIQPALDHVGAAPPDAES